MSRVEKSPGRQGFTLIELLVVIAIIAVLISILLPSMRLARSQAQKILCLTNLKAQGEMVMMYAHDNNDQIMRGIHDLPPAPEWGSYFTALLKLLHYDGTMNQGARGIWEGGLNQPWLKEVAASIPQYQCPRHPNEAVIDYVTSAIPIPYTARNRSRDVGNAGQRGERYRGEGGTMDYIGLYGINGVDRYGPAKLVLTTEAHESLYRGWPQGVRFNHFFFGSQLPFAAWPRIANDARHEGFINCLFFDGHAASIQLTQFDIGWPKDLALRMRWISTPVEDE
ncbi:MAG: type II secretion system protein [Planctomycetes bacterium]|nr:type II secretion system protein [Planctomycetota bacterium]